MGSVPQMGAPRDFAADYPARFYAPTQVQVWRSKNNTESGIRIDLNGEAHRFKLKTIGTWESWSVTAGEPMREGLAKRDALEWVHPNRPTFHLIELMVPLGKPKLFRLRG